MKSIALRIFITFIFLFNTQAFAADLYSGMLKQQGEQLIFSKCGIVSADFIMAFENKVLKDELPDLNENSVVQLQVIGNVEMENDKYYIYIQKINKIVEGTSCNLLDML